MNEDQNKPRRLTPEENKALQFEREQLRHAEEAGCSGLIGGWAFSVHQKRDMDADEATHDDDPFICKACRSDAILRKCTDDRRDHYAHHARLSPIVEAEETELHKGCLAEICAALKQKFPDGNWGVNRPIPANEKLGVGEVVPDVSGRIGNQRIAIEAQVSSLSIPKIIKRSAVYTKRNIPLIWLVPLKEDLGSEPFRPRLYERYLHMMYLDRVYYWLPGFGTMLQPVHYGVAFRHIPFAEWYDKEAEEEREAGGYEKAYKVIKSPVPSAKIDITTQFKLLHHPEFRPWNERRTVPPLLLWKDILQDWWDKSDDEAFRKRFKEDNLPKERREKQKPPPPPMDWR